MKTKTKLIILTASLIIQLINLFFLSANYPEVSIVISLICFAVVVAFAVAGVVAFAVVVVVVLADLIMEYLKEKKKERT